MAVVCVMRELTDLEEVLLVACRTALRQLDYDGDDKTAFTGAAFDALTKAIAAAEGPPQAGSDLRHVAGSA